MSIFAWLTARLGLPIASVTFCTACAIILFISKHLASRAAFNAFQGTLNLTPVRQASTPSAAAAEGAARARDRATNNNKVDVADTHVQRAAAHLHPGQHWVQLFGQPQPYNHNSSTTTTRSSSSSSRRRRNRSGIPPPFSSAPMAVPAFPLLTLRDQFGDEGLVRVVSWNVERGKR